MFEPEHVGLEDFTPKEFPYDPTDPVQLAEGANFRLETNLGQDRAPTHPLFITQKNHPNPHNAWVHE